MACSHYHWKLDDFIDKVANYTAHLHISDASGVDGEGVQIGNGDVDFVKLIKMIHKEEKRRSKSKKIHIPMRPDHGHCLLDDQNKNNVNPGYTAIGRLMGLSELRGIIKALKE